MSGIGEVQLRCKLTVISSSTLFSPWPFASGTIFSEKLSGCCSFSLSINRCHLLGSSRSTFLFFVSLSVAISTSLGRHLLILVLVYFSSIFFLPWRKVCSFWVWHFKSVYRLLWHALQTILKSSLFISERRYRRYKHLFSCLISGP